MKSRFLTGSVALFLSVCLAGIASADIVVSEGLGSGAYTASSNYYVETLPDKAFDGDFSNMWNAGTWPMAWIEVDLGRPTDITQILMTVEQTPSYTDTVHEIWLSSSTIGADTSGAVLAQTLVGTTYTGQTLSVVFPTPKTAQHVQIRTISSPSWVAWREIQIMAPDRGTLNDCSPCLSWNNHGEYVRCVAQAVNALVLGGTVTDDEGDAIISSAAQSQVGKKGYIPPVCQ